MLELRKADILCITRSAAFTAEGYSCVKNRVDPRRKPPLGPPDFAFELGLRLANGRRAPLASAALAHLTHAATRAPDLVRQPFISSGFVDGRERCEIWLAAEGAQTKSANDSRLARAALLDASEAPSERGAAFALGSPPSTLERFVASALPARVDGEGRADPDGDIHLAFNLALRPPNQVALEVTASYLIGGKPAASCAIQLIDTISVADGVVACSTQKVETIGRSGDVAAIAMLIPCPAHFAIQNALDEIRSNLFLCGPALTGVGGIVAALCPKQILLPGIEREKLVFTYDRVRVDQKSGIVAHGRARTAPRKPAVEIAGPQRLEVPRLSSGTGVAELVYGLRTQDLRPPFRRVDWTFDGSPNPPLPRMRMRSREGDGPASAHVVDVKVHYRHANVPGSRCQSTVSVRVVDADGVIGPALAPSTLTTTIVVGDPCDRPPRFGSPEALLQSI